MDNFSEGMAFAYKQFGKACKLAAERLKNFVNSVYKGLNADPEIKKYLMISNRTKNRRIKKKQMTKIAKRLNEVKKYGKS